MSKRLTLKGLYGYRWIISALVCVCAFSLSAQTYYRVHKDEFAHIAKFFDYQKFFYFVVASPDKGAAISSDVLKSSRAYLNSVEVSVSDDQELLMSKGQGENKSFNFAPKEGSTDLYNIADSVSGSLLGVTKSGETYRFEYFSDPDAIPTGSSADFKIIFDNQNDGFVQIMSGMKNANASILTDVNSNEQNIFRVRADEYSDLGIYRLDFFDWTIDDSDLTKSGNIKLISTPHKNVSGSDGIKLHYILNDGDEVSVEDLVNEGNMIDIARFNDGDNIIVSIPTNETVSRASDENTTLWALPVLHVEELNDLVPLGKVITKKYADDGISTGVVIAVEDVAGQEPVYYTLDGRKAVMPLVPGVYVRRIGNKADKVIIR